MRRIDREFSLLVAIRGLIEGKPMALYYDTGEPTGGWETIAMATLEEDYSILIDLPVGQRYVCRLTKGRRR